MAPEAPAAWSLLRPWWPAHCAWRWRLLATGAPLVAGLPPGEAQAVAQAVHRRQLEFATGRWCARAALGDLGLATQAIGVGPDRAPQWPAGVVGTISHDDTWCVAGVALRPAWSGLGIDIERIDRVRADMAAVVCTPAERARLQAGQGAWALAQIFSIKEAAFKALYPGVRTWIDFQDAELIHLPAQAAGPCRLRLLRPVGHLPAGQELGGAVAVAEGRVLSLLALA